MEVSIVTRNQFGHGTLERLDPEYVRSSLLSIEKMLAAGNGAQVLSSLASVNDGANYVAQAGAEAEVEYVDLDSVHLDDGLALPDAMAVESLPSRAKHMVEARDILVANVRPNRGAIAYAATHLENAVASSGFSLVRANDELLAPYLFLFLRSKYGVSQLIRRARGSMYPAVLPRDVESVLVPTPFADIRRAAREAMARCELHWADFLQGFEEARRLLAELVAFVGSPPSLLYTHREGVDSRVIGRSECYGDGSAFRIDAEFFREEHMRFRIRATKAGAVALGSLANLDQGRVKAGDELVPTFRQSSLTNFGINWSAIPMEPGAVGDAFVEDGDVLLAAMAHEAHYLARKADAVSGMPEQLYYNQATHHLMRVRLKDGSRSSVSANYIAAFLRSDTGRYQVQRCNRGLRGDHVRPDDLAQEVLVVLPDHSWLARFDEQIDRAERARRDAVQAVREGVLLVEEWIVGRRSN